MIRAERLSFHIGDFQLRQLDLDVAQGKYFVLLGPPGSGKTILLECLCGLRRILSGRITIDGCDVTGHEPRLRDIGYVPQDYALFPHLSIERNIAFGLHVAGFDRRTVLERVVQTTEMLGIGHMLKRSVEGISGGERQRVALARALVLQPKVLLLDEPVCALDEATRQDVCAELHRIQRQFGVTTIHVSHNLEEVFSVADNAGVLCQGQFQQIGSIDELLRKPQNEFVARFMRCENILSGQVVHTDPQSENSMVQCGKARLIVPGRHQGQVKFVIRPENVCLTTGREHRDSINKLPMKLRSFRDCGNYVKIELSDDVHLVAHLSHSAFTELNPKPQSELIVHLHPENIHVLPESTPC
jgi:ABC-type Fe3+/spermidine/putrescine transport system ATPase subunit